MKTTIMTVIAGALLSAFSSTAATADVCKANTTVAASAYSQFTGYTGTPTTVTYSNTVTNIGGAWDPVSHEEFTAPCDGTYAFAIDFVRDSIRNDTSCGTTVGTVEDIFIQYWKQPAAGGSAVQIGNSYGAWIGQTTTATYRAGASYNVVVPLSQGDTIFTKVYSDGNQFLCLASANFTGFKVGK